MLAECLSYCLTPCPSWARRLGLLHNSIAIGARYRRCRAAWQTHLQHSRAALLDSAAQCERYRSALILGSGALLDIPLAELAGQFQRVYLVDAVHPWRARYQARRYPNVVCVSHDLTECAADWLALPTPLRAADLMRLAQRTPQAFLHDDTIDWVASVNVWSQLPWAFIRHAQTDDDAALTAFSQALLQQHLNYLRRFNSTVCLIADREQLSYDRQGQRIAHSDFTAWLADWRTRREWCWEIAPLGELERDMGSRHQVIAAA